MEIKKNTSSDYFSRQSSHLLFVLSQLLRIPTPLWMAATIGFVMGKSDLKITMCPSKGGTVRMLCISLLIIPSSMNAMEVADDLWLIIRRIAT